MVTVSGSPLWNNSFSIIDFGIGSSARPPSVLDTRSVVGFRITARESNRNSTMPNSTLDQRDTGIDWQNGLRLGGISGAFLNLNMMLAVQQASEEGSARGLRKAEQKQVAELRQVDAAVRRTQPLARRRAAPLPPSQAFTYWMGNAIR